jgi:hypothetical protein
VNSKGLSCAKSFLLYLISKDVITWNSLIFRATRDQRCKHPLIAVMEYLKPDFDESTKRMDEWHARHKEMLQL